MPLADALGAGRGTLLHTPGAVRRAGAFLIPPELRIQRQQVDDRHDQAASAPDFAIPVSVATADGVLPASLHNWINLV